MNSRGFYFGYELFAPGGMGALVGGNFKISNGKVCLVTYP